MKIEETYQNNIYNIRMLATYLGADEKTFLDYYQELRDDSGFLDAINVQVQWARETHHFTKGIFKSHPISSIDWFAFQRILLYILVRHFKPSHILETGVFYGGNTVFLLNGLHKNGAGELTSIDYPAYEMERAAGSQARHVLVGDSESYSPELTPGFIIPPVLKDKWKLIIGDSLKEIPNIKTRFDLYLHDSEHSMTFLTKELELAWNCLSPKGIAVVDDIDWSNAFFAFCVRHRLSPALFTDNGKDNLRVRTGLCCKEHPKNQNESFN